MFANKRRDIHTIDWITLSLYLGLLGIGWLMIYTVGYNEGYDQDFFETLGSTTIGKHTIWIAVSLFTLFIALIIDWKFWGTFAYLIFGFGIFLLILVLFLGTEIKGAKSWFVLGGFSFQPVEIAKFGTCLAVAAYLNNFNSNLKETRSQLIAMGIIALPFILVGFFQPDAGSALVFLAFLIPFFREGLSSNFFILAFFGSIFLLTGLVFSIEPVILSVLLLGTIVLAFNLKEYKYHFTALAIVAAVASFWIFEFFDEYYVLGFNLLFVFVLGLVHWMKGRQRLVISLFSALLLGATIAGGANYFFNNVLKSHQQDRINVWLRPGICDPQGSLYNVIQSKMAIGSGGLKGKGFLEGNMTKLNYVPEQTTDFIFCTIGEEQGFIGSASVILLFFLLMYRITILAERQRSRFSRIYMYGVAGILFIHVFINIGMTMGLMPIIGIPLPFISKGGSSLLGFTLLLGVMLKMDKYREMP